mmetsp:Transcript_12411/g.33857  ORF Transcript_12411/g.33857 Transcript_12411/m.33857 type:complete len:89 (+) Transcript_12411:362-628(+)
MSCKLEHVHTAEFDCDKKTPLPGCITYKTNPTWQQFMISSIVASIPLLGQHRLQIVKHHILSPWSSSPAPSCWAQVDPTQMTTCWSSD